MINEGVFSIKIGGMAGQGIKSIGLVFSKLATRSGYHVYNYIEYPSLIRGGHNVMEINFSLREVVAPKKSVDLLIALDQNTINYHKDELAPNGKILEPGPLKDLADGVGGSLYLNTVAIGAATALLGGDLNLLKTLLTEEFNDPKNLAAVEAGYKFGATNAGSQLKLQENVVPKMIVNANDATAMGAIAAGMQFASIYPMSPSSGILHTLAKYQNDFGYIYKQPEDEISAVNMAIGASFAGARSMTATSGGGFSLMVEGLGLAGVSETPIVMIDAMRPGPATGMPTWSEQGDLQFVLHAAQGDFPRIVLAPGDAKETFELTRLAFNLADKYQTAVILLTDKNLCDNDQSFPLFDQKNFEFDRGKFSTEVIPDYKRYALSDDGISLRTVPGSGNHILGTSYEHDPNGFASEEIVDRNSQMEKRMKKLATCALSDLPKPVLYGPETAEKTIVSWGSNKGAILEAIKDHPDVNFLHLTWINPFPTEAVKEILGKAKHIINIECNQMAQMGNLIREKTGIEITDNLLKYDGRPFFPEEIAGKLT